MRLVTYLDRGKYNIWDNRKVIDFCNQLFFCFSPIEYVILNTKIILLDISLEEVHVKKVFQ